MSFEDINPFNIHVSRAVDFLEAVDIKDVPKEDLEKALEPIGVALRVVEEDGIKFDTKDPLRTDRINITVKDGKIIDAKVF